MIIYFLSPAGVNKVTVTDFQDLLVVLSSLFLIHYSFHLVGAVKVVLLHPQSAC